MTNDAFSANDSGLPDGTRRALFALPAVAFAALVAPGPVFAVPSADPMAAVFADYLAALAACDAADLDDAESARRYEIAEAIGDRILATPCRTAQDLARKIMIASGFGSLDLFDGSDLARPVLAEIATLSGAEWEASDV